MTNEEKAEGTPETAPNKVRRKGSRVKRSEDKESSKKSRDRKKSKDAVTQKERKKKREKGESTPKEKKRRGSRAQKPRKKDLEKVENEEKDTNSSTPEVSTPNEATPARSEENEAPADVQETTLDEPEAKQEETPEKKSEETAEVNQEESETKKEEPKEEPKEDSKEEQKALEAAKKEPEVPEVKEEPKDNNQLSKSKGSVTKDKKKVTKTTTPPVQTNMKPIQPAQDDTPKEKRRFGFPFRKKKKEAVVGGIIAGSVKHEGHAGFESGGGLSTKGLPPHIAEIFEKLNKTFIDLGYDEITQNEVKFVLQKFGHILIPSNPTPPPPAPAPVSPEELSFEELLEQFKTQNATLQGLKATHTTIQTAKEKLKAEVEQLNEVLAQERKLLNEQQEKNTTLEVEAARLRSSGSAAGNDNTAFTDLEALMKTKLDEAAKKLAAEQEKTKELQKLLDQYADEKAALQKSLGEAEEIIKQNRTNLSSSKSTPTPSPSAPPANIPAPPPMNIPPPPVAPPLGDMGNKTNKPATGGGGGLNLNVTLKKTEPIEKPKSGPTTDDLLKQIRSGTALKKVEHDPSERKPASDADDSNVLNIIAKALLDRRNGITMDDEANPDDEWGDDDWE